MVLIAESQPYQDLEGGALGGEAGDGHGVAALRLDDDGEFPPMTHKNDWVQLFSATTHPIQVHLLTQDFVNINVQLVGNPKL